MKAMLLRENIRFPRQSFNREKYSRPCDVLLPNRVRHGVGSFRFQDVPPQLRSGKPALDRFDFSVVHVPCPRNYSHSEMRVAKNGRVLGNDEGRRVTNLVKTTFCSRLAKSLSLDRWPTPGERLAWLRRRFGQC
jgi:hypothetical protein